MKKIPKLLLIFLALQNSAARKVFAEPSPFDLDLTPDSSALESTTSKPNSQNSAGQSPVSTAIQNLNPDISFVADMLGGNKAALTQKGDPVQRPVDMREVEIDGNGYISPYAKGNFVASFSGGGVDIEEAFMNFFTLPGGLNVRVGKFRVDLDTLNPTHQHAIPFADQPLVFHHTYGQDGLIAVGVNASILIPNPFDQYLIASFSYGANTFDGSQYTALYGGNTDSMLMVGRLGTSFDFSGSSYLTLNTSAVLAPILDHSITQIYEIEALYRYSPNPVNNAITFLNGILWNRGNPTLTNPFSTNGLYSYLGWQFSPNWRIGGRYDQTNNPTFDGREKQYAGILTFYPTETNFIRLQYAQHQLPEAFLKPSTWESRVWLQIDVSIGPHQQHTAL